jgi:hypothetical protein
MDLGKIRETIKNAPARAGGFFKRLPEKLKGMKGFLDEKAGPLADKLLSRIPKEKRGALFFCLGGIIVFFICFTVIMMAAGTGRPSEGGEIVELTIPPEDLFFPGEPDFVPSLLLEREPRQFWTPGDAVPFWKDPGTLGRDRWLKEMELVIDKLMEDIP